MYWCHVPQKGWLYARAVSELCVSHVSSSIHHSQFHLPQPCGKIWVATPPPKTTLVCCDIKIGFLPKKVCNSGNDWRIGFHESPIANSLTTVPSSPITPTKKVGWKRLGCISKSTGIIPGCTSRRRHWEVVTQRDLSVVCQWCRKWVPGRPSALTDVRHPKETVETYKTRVEGSTTRCCPLRKHTEE